VSYDVEIRNEAQLHVYTIRDLADKLFDGDEVPAKPPVPPLSDIIMRSVMARRLQNAWILYQYRKREVQDFNKSMYYNNK
jgi:hypothetical protein